jgi:hypothetical protein
MKRSEVIKELLSSYYFQNGERVDNKVIKKARNMINQFKKEENYKHCEECYNYNIGDGYDDITVCEGCKYYNK